jgi:hypothetical protein
VRAPSAPQPVNRYLGMLYLLYPQFADFDLFDETREYYTLFYHHALEGVHISIEEEVSIRMLCTLRNHRLKYAALRWLSSIRLRMRIETSADLANKPPLSPLCEHSLTRAEYAGLTQNAF